MSFVWATCVKDWRRRMRDPAALLLWIGIPVLIGAILSLLSGGREGPKPQALVLVVDRDDSFVSGLLVGALSQDRLGGVMRAEAVELEAGRRRVEAGEASALLVIPEGFGEAVLLEKPATLTLRTNPAQRILPGIVEESLAALGEGVFYLHRVLGDEVRAIAEGPDAGTPGIRDGQVADIAVRIHHAVEELRGVLFPPVIALETGPEAPDPTVAATDPAAPDTTAAGADPAAAAGGDAARASVALLFVPGLLFMSFLFMAAGIAEDLWTERAGLTLRRAAMTPHAPSAILLGKILAGAGVFLLVAAVALAVAWAWFHLAWTRYPLAVAWSAFSAVLLLLIFCAIHVHAPTRRGASVLSTAIVFPLMMLGGSFFPFEAMPAWMAAVGRWTPNGWALARLKDVLLGRAEAAGMALSAVSIAAAGALLFALAARRLGGAFVRSAP